MDIPNFKNVKIVRNMSDSWAEFIKIQPKLLSDEKVEIKAEQLPIFLHTNKCKQVWQDGNFAEINEMREMAEKSLKPIHSNIRLHGLDAFMELSNGTYMSFTKDANIWLYPHSQKSVTLEDGKLSTQITVQVGTYSENSKILGLSTFILSSTADLLGSLLGSATLAFILQEIIITGAQFLVSALLEAVSAVLAEHGLARIIVTTAVESFPLYLTVGIVVLILFIGILYLWNWINQKYTIQLQIMNWDTENDFEISDYYWENAKFTHEDEQSLKDIVLPKMLKKGDVVVPPGFNPQPTLDCVCHYALIVIENDSTFFQGCSLALKINELKRDDSNDEYNGFVYAFTCPWRADNKQAASSENISAKEFYNKAHLKPITNINTKSSGNTDIAINLDKITGGEKDVYNVIVNINK